MTTDRIKEIQSKTAYPNSISVKQALLQVWNECEQEQLRIADVSQQRELLLAFGKSEFKEDFYRIVEFEKMVDRFLANNCG